MGSVDSWIYLTFWIELGRVTKDVGRVELDRVDEDPRPTSFRIDSSLI